MSTSMNRKSLRQLLIVFIVVAAISLVPLLVAQGTATPFSIEAEASGNTIVSPAKIASCSVCSGGSEVGYLGMGGTLQFNSVSVNAAGSYTLRIAYISGAARSAVMSVNGGAGKTLDFASTGAWTTLGTMDVTVNLNAGSNTIKFSNASAYAPDFDKITVMK